MQRAEDERSTPRVATKVPVVMDLEPGTYYWCSCGRSEGQPFCDGSHRGTAFTPVEIVVSEKQEKVPFCTCKRAATGYRCDGAHRNI